MISNKLLTGQYCSLDHCLGYLNLVLVRWQCYGIGYSNICGGFGTGLIDYLALDEVLSLGYTVRIAIDRIEAYPGRLDDSAFAFDTQKY